MEEYKIEVIMTPHYDDYSVAPYFWCILKTSDGHSWSNASSGWAITPQRAFDEAYKTYSSMNKYSNMQS